MTYLAVPISARDVLAAKAQIAAAVEAGAEILELRTDYLNPLTLDSAMEVFAAASGTGLPYIVTCRDAREGGANNWPVEHRLNMLLAAVTAGASFIDWEFANFQDIAVRNKLLLAIAASETRLILSAHEFEGRFRDLRGLYERIVAVAPAAVPKLVYTAEHINDCWPAMELLRRKVGDAIVLVMGEAGIITRLLASKLGGLITFASLGGETATASGQVDISTFRKLYRYRSINEATELFGVIASPVAHSKSPHIHNACFEAAGMNRLYLPLLVEGSRERFEVFMDSALSSGLDFGGFSVTIPHKHNALDYVRSRGGRIEPLAERIGAVNTIVNGPDGLAGYNTDLDGALDAVTARLGISRVAVKGWPVAVLGAGGAARAVVAGLADAGADVTIYNRTVSRARELAAEFGCRYADIDGIGKGFSPRLVVNCTSIGMHPHVNASPLPAGVIRPGMAVFDTVYNPPRTLLLEQAEAAGAVTIDGIEMFVRQAMAQFRLFTGRDADAEVMRRALG